MTDDEIKKRAQCVKNEHSGGSDSITAEILKADMATTVTQLRKLFKTIWDNEQIPNIGKKGSIVKILKKGNLTK